MIRSSETVSANDGVSIGSKDELRLKRGMIVVSTRTKREQMGASKGSSCLF